MARRLTQWVVEEMVRQLAEDRDVCLVLHPAMVPANGVPRVIRDGRRWLLHRYLYYRMEGEDSPMLFLQDGTCQTLGCMNPYHRWQAPKGSARVHRRCPNNHEYRASDIRPDGTRQCGRCKRAHRERHNAKRRKGKYRRGWCPKGHRMTRDNVYITTSKDGRTHRKCRICAIDRQRTYRERKKNG